MTGSVLWGYVMSRYIDADAIRAKLMEYIGLTNGFDRAFSEAPSIDIVRCKECKWWLKNLTEDDEDEAYLHCPIEDGKPDDFCSYGERAGQTILTTDCSWK